MALFAEEELEKVRSLMARTELSRDDAIVCLVQHEWDLEEAVYLWLTAANSTRADAPPALEVGSAIRCRQTCGRTIARHKNVCCLGCPARHTRTCNERLSRERGAARASGEAEPEPESAGDGVAM